jgi:hypothetical protein
MAGNEAIDSWAGSGESSQFVLYLTDFEDRPVTSAEIGAKTGLRQGLAGPARYHWGGGRPAG